MRFPPAGCAAAARRECLLRYRQKKLRRLDSNTIRYMKRKINADKRPRSGFSSKPSIPRPLGAEAEFGTAAPVTCWALD